MKEARTEGRNEGAKDARVPSVALKPPRNGARRSLLFECTSALSDLDQFPHRHRHQSPSDLPPWTPPCEMFVDHF